MAEGKDIPISEPEKGPDKRLPWWKRLWARTGFGDKTLWDLLQLLVVPLALAAIGFWFAAQQDANQQRIENQRAETEREIAEQRAQDEALQAYLDQMSQLMLERKLLEAEEGDPVHTLAQARTSTVILRLDAQHNESVTGFLIDAGLAVSGEASPRLLRNIALMHATLSGAFLPRADLSDAFLSDATLSDAFLEKADLSGATLINADVSGATLINADLSGAFLHHADLDAPHRSANLSGADLSDADLRDANLRDAILDRADLSGARLSSADLSGATLGLADLSKADLSNAEGITSEELDQQSISLKGATRPNGQKYEDWLKSKDREEGKNEGSS